MVSKNFTLHEIKHLSKKVKIIFLKADVEHGEWIFYTKIKGCIRLSDLYKKANKKIIFRATLPLLISFVKNEVNILSNESSQIMRLLNTNFVKTRVHFLVKSRRMDRLHNYHFYLALQKYAQLYNR